MIKRAKILESTISGIQRVFKIEEYKNTARRSEQFGAGGEDYNPPLNSESISANVNGARSGTVTVLFKDFIQKIAKRGEKIIYSTDQEGNTIKAKIYFTFDGKLIIITESDINIDCGGKVVIDSSESVDINATTNVNVSGADVVINATSVSVNATNISLGSGAGASPIARVGDTVQVSSTTHVGTITSGGNNTST